MTDEERQGASARGSLHLKDYFRVLVARRWVLISTFALVVLGATVWVLVQTPIYRAEAILLIEPGKVEMTNFRPVDPTMAHLGSEIDRRQFYETQYKLIVARPLLERTFAQFNFGQRRQFRGNSEPIVAFAQLFDVAAVRRSRLVSVTFDWEDPELAARVVDFLVNEYITDNRQRGLGVQAGGLDSLRKEADKLKPQVQDAADQLQKYMMETGVISFEDDTNIIAENLNQTIKKFNTLKAERSALESTCETIRRALASGSIEDVPEVEESATIRELKLEYGKVNQELMGLLGRFGESHPEVRSARERMTAAVNQIKAEEQMILESTNSKLERKKQEEKELLADYEEQQTHALKFQGQKRQYEFLKNTKETLQETYDAIDGRIKQIQITMAAGNKDDNIFIITPAKPPTRAAKPRKTMAVALAAFFGLVIGVGLCFFVDYLDTTVKTKDEAEALLGVPVIGHVPALLEGDVAESNGRAMELLAVSKPRSALAEAFRSLRTALSFSTADEELRRLLITSSSPREGKTLVSVNVAVAMAQGGKKVLLIDADLRKPRLHKVFRSPSMPGLSSLLVDRGGTTLEEVIRPIAGVDNLSFLPAGPIPPNPAELLGSSRMESVVAELEEGFDLLVFDTPPVVNVTDPIVLSRFVQGMLLVIRCFSTQRDLARRTGGLLGQAKAEARLLGLVLNNVDVPRGGYYSSDSYYYYQQYYYYYGDDETRAKRKRRQRRGRTAHSR